jgi:hypothetical protein
MTGWIIDESTFNQIIWITGTIFTGVGWSAHWVWEKLIRSRWYAYLDKRFPKGIKVG